MPNDRWDEAMNEHDGILNALVGRDPITIAAILKTHLRNQSKQVVSAGFAIEATQDEDRPPDSSRKTANSTAKMRRAKV